MLNSKEMETHLQQLRKIKAYYLTHEATQRLTDEREETAIALIEQSLNTVANCIGELAGIQLTDTVFYQEEQKGDNNGNE